MIIEADDTRLLEHAQRAHDRATDDVLADARMTAPRRTGAYAASLERIDTETPDGVVSRIGSRRPEAPAIENGADVGDRQGPHMAPAGTLARAGRRYPEHMTRRLRQEPI